LRQPLSTIRTVLRYVSLYEPARTLVKVRGSRHMRQQRPADRRRSRARETGAHVGIIGCGNFAYTTIAYFLVKNAGPVIRGTMDIDGARAQSLASRYHAHFATDDPAEIIENDAIDLIY